MEGTSAGVGAGINVVAEVPNPILDAEIQGEGDRYVPESQAWSKEYRRKFSRLFEQLTNELDIMSRHEAKVQKIRFELMQLLEKGDKKAKKGKK